MGQYVEQALAAHFGPLLAMVAKAEHAAAAQGLPPGTPPAAFAASDASPVIKDFAARWTASLEALHRPALPRSASLPRPFPLRPFPPRPPRPAPPPPPAAPVGPHSAARRHRCVAARTPRQKSAERCSGRLSRIAAVD